MAPKVICHEHRIKAHPRLHVKRQLVTRGVKGAYSTSLHFVIVSSLLQSSCEQSRSSSLESECVLPLESRRRTKGLLVVVVSRQSQEYFAASREARRDNQIFRCSPFVGARRLKSACRRIRRKLRIAPEGKKRVSVLPCQGRSSSGYLVTT